MRRLAPLCQAAVALALIAACHQDLAPQAEIPALTVDEVQRLVEAGQASVFDNNSQDRWAKGHVPTAQWLSFKEVKASALPEDKGRTLVFYCANEH